MQLSFDQDSVDAVVCHSKRKVTTSVNGRVRERWHVMEDGVTRIFSDPAKAYQFALEVLFRELSRS